MRKKITGCICDYEIDENGIVYGKNGKLKFTKKNSGNNYYTLAVRKGNGGNISFRQDDLFKQFFLDSKENWHLIKGFDYNVYISDSGMVKRKRDDKKQNDSIFYRYFKTTSGHLSLYKDGQAYSCTLDELKSLAKESKLSESSFLLLRSIRREIDIDTLKNIFPLKCFKELEDGKYIEYKINVLK